MFGIVNKRTGEFAARRYFYRFVPCKNHEPPILYTRKWDADNKCRRLNRGLIFHSVPYGHAMEGDTLEVVEVEVVVKNSP